MLLIDTNILLRYILKDNERLTKKAADIISCNKVVCLNAMIYEAIHVLSKIYGVPRIEIADELLGLIQDEIIFTDDKMLSLQTLTIFKETSMDFIDCLLIARHMIYKDSVQSFDKKLKNYIARHHG